MVELALDSTNRHQVCETRDRKDRLTIIPSTPTLHATLAIYNKSFHSLKFCLHVRTRTGLDVLHHIATPVTVSKENDLYSKIIPAHTLVEGIGMEARPYL